MALKLVQSCSLVVLFMSVAPFLDTTLVPQRARTPHRSHRLTLQSPDAIRPYTRVLVHAAQAAYLSPSMGSPMRRYAPYETYRRALSTVQDRASIGCILDPVKRRLCQVCDTLCPERVRYSSVSTDGARRVVAIPIRYHGGPHQPPILVTTLDTGTPTLVARVCAMILSVTLDGRYRGGRG